MTSNLLPMNEAVNFSVLAQMYFLGSLCGSVRNIKGLHLMVDFSRSWKQ